MYQSIDINVPADFDQLEKVILEAYNPKDVGAILKAKVGSRCRTLLIEYPYVDKDYRSTYYHYYSKKGYRYDLDCVRLHFFQDAIKISPGLALTSRGRVLSDSYSGYMILRPTRLATIGRTVLSPGVVDGFHGHIIDGCHPVHLLGNRFEVRGFPSMAQHTDISVCAHVACWSILRHYSQRYSQYAEFLTHDVTRMAQEFDPGGLLPSMGLQLQHAERIFAAAGTYPLIVTKDSNTGLFYRQLHAYVESGIPIFAALNSNEHAVAVVGHGEVQPVGSTPAAAYFAADLTKGLVVIDDNHLSYKLIKRNQRTPYGTKNIDAFIVPLPDKIYYSAEAVDELSALLASGNFFGFDHSSLGPPVIRYFLTTATALRKSVNKLRSQLDPDLVQIIMNLAFPKFVWVVEISSVAQWDAGQVATRAIIDATASPYEDDPLFLMYDQDHAHIVDRGGDHSHSRVTLNSPSGAVMSRMTGNLSQH